MIPFLLSFNSDLAGAAVFLLLFLLVGVWSVFYKKITFRYFVLLAGVLPGIVVTFVLYYFAKLYFQIESSGVGGSGQQVFTGTNFLEMLLVFSEVISQTFFPHNFYIGLLLFAVIFYGWVVLKRKDKNTRSFIVLSLALLFISYFFFSSNKGYRSWHIVYLPPVIFISVLLMIREFRKNVRLAFAILIFGSNIVFFAQRFTNHLEYSSDASMLYNQLSVLDWIYMNNDDDGFDVYTYTNTFYDYPYQYLFWWYGNGKYKFMPCEYANYPKSPKETYVPGYLSYSEPKLGCNRLRFLIVESETNGQSNEKWVDGFRRDTSLVEDVEVGRIRVEKREVKL